jgi:hypothetical protein
VAKFLIEIPHEAETVACARVVHVFLTSGSHLLSNADWGCMDGVHVSWIIVDVDSKAEARAIVPPAFRAEAKITALCKFTLGMIDGILKQHKAEGAG